MADNPPTPLISDLTGVAKLADSKLANTVYEDSLQKTATEVGKLGGEFSKTVRLALQPLFTAIQGGSKRVNGWVEDAVKSVPPERRVEAKPALLNAVVAAIGVEEDDSAIRATLTKLIASMVDRDRQQDLHPAFPRIAQELSARDALLLQIMPHGNGIVLPEALANKNVLLSTGLIQTLENFTDASGSGQRQRFFVGVSKARDDDRSVLLTAEARAHDEEDHLGLLEFIIPVHFGPGEIHLDNLLRLQLATQAERKSHFSSVMSPPYQNTIFLPILNVDQEEPDEFIDRFYIFSSRRATGRHLKSLMSPQAASSAIYTVASRTELGRIFARCCIPDFSGETVWQPREGT
jgi:Abortive infection alpha